MVLETTIQATIHNLTTEADIALRETARRFQAARRTAFRRLPEGQEREQIEPLLRTLFQMDARYARDAILEAQSTHRALRALLPNYLTAIQVKIQQVERRLERLEEDKRIPRGCPLPQAIASLERRLNRLQAKRDHWQAHLDAGTTPAVIFGGALAFYARRKGCMSRAEWQARRRAQFWSRGERDGGNRHMHITAHSDGFRISIATLPQIGRRLPRVLGNLWAAPAQRDLLRRGLADAYCVRVLQQKNGWAAHITVREQVEGSLLLQAPADARVGGLDCNTDRLTVAIASPQGNLLGRHTVWMRGLPDMEVGVASHTISHALNAAMEWLQAQGTTCLVVEQLKFAQTHDIHRRRNRARTWFRSTMAGLAIRKALRQGMGVVKVNPAYSSVIGQHKYATNYGMSGHEAAAFVLARRGQGRDEKLPISIVMRFPDLRERLLIAAQRELDMKRRRKYFAWADKLTKWKVQHLWSLWAIWDGASDLLSM